MSRARFASRKSADGLIEADAVYTIRSFMMRLGIGRHSLAALRRKGLRVRPIGQRLFVDGSEALELLRRVWREQDAN